MDKPVIAARLELEAEQHLVAPPERVFPLLCPVREADWLEDWNHRLIHSGSGVAEQDAVFTTSDPESGELDIWTITRHQPPREIEFLRVNRQRVIRYTISLEPEDGGGTCAHWRQLVTVVDGSTLTNITQEAFTDMVAVDERALNHYLVTGRMLRGNN